jgi:peptide/nickel transport system substrate-binding protein
MPTRRAFLTSTFGVTAVALLAACSGGAAPPPPGSTQVAPAQTTGSPQAGGQITFGLENDPINFDPLLSNAFIDRNVHYQIYDSLVRVDTSGKIIPWLADKWDTSADGKVVTFSLRRDVKYHDGTPFDAESVKWNIDRYINTDGSFRKGELAPVDSVEVVDPATVRFNLKTAFAPFLSLLVDRAGMMVSRKAVEAGGQDFTRKAYKAGTGPFMLTEAVKDDHVTLEKNPDWWGRDSAGNRLPYLDKITIHPITDPTVRLTNVKTGNADVINNVAGKDVATAKADPNLVYASVPGLAFDSLIPNRKAGFIFEEGRYVKAVSMALDRQEILDKVFLGQGVVGYGTIAPPHFAYDPAFRPFEKPDVDGAKQLVAAVGKGPLEFELLVTAGDSQQLQLAQTIQAQLKKADITVDITQLEFAQILKQQTDHVFKGMSQVGWSGRIDPDGNTYDHVYTGRPFNDASYSNQQVDQLLDQQRTTTDEAQRRDALRKAEQIYVVDDPARVWFRFRVAEILSAKKLQGLEVYPDWIIRFQYAWLQK